MTMYSSGDPLGSTALCGLVCWQHPVLGLVVATADLGEQSVRHTTTIESHSQFPQ
jgi:hypothetical protein